MLDKLDFGRTECVVRVNAVSSGLMEEDLRVILQAKRMPSTIMLPKVDRPEEIDHFTKRLKSAMKDRPDSTRPYLITFVESAMGLMNLKNIFSKAYDLQLKEKLYILDGVVFGSDDYCADIGATRTSDALSLLYARQKIVACAKAFRLQAIDMVDIDYKDLEGLKKQATEGANMGFTGKQVIHPNQIPIVQDTFCPSKDQIEWAKELIQAFEHHQKSGLGAFTFQNRMIDMPLVLQARNIVQLAESINI
ncbi:hypothetical protein FSP39_020145 [Pinctada imbricata]|uniref:Citramalyl-CoA lyase, mitochondrial n=1 Tax=Pinctada imbricata TaxID=66713 RepID=A0AA89BXY5_PINIB|nr:hypothetical protein FSP39_020145 [Pinctada imbricata]